MTKKQFIRVLVRNNAEWDESMQDAGLLQVDAPRGFVFSANNCHTIVEAFSNKGKQSWKGEAYAEVARLVEQGLHKCSDSDCDICHP